MGNEGQFAGLSVRTRRGPALARSGRGRGYLDDIRRFAMLERDQEYNLAKRWREHGDRNAANQLVTSHLRLAVKIAMGYRGYGLPVSDIIAEGNVGLMQALNRFEPEKGFRFATYAMWWIRASIHDYILRSWSLVKIGTTANQKKLFFKLRSAKSKIAALETGDLHPDQAGKFPAKLAELTGSQPGLGVWRVVEHQGYSVGGALESGHRIENLGPGQRQPVRQDHLDRGRAQPGGPFYSRPADLGAGMARADLAGQPGGLARIGQELGDGVEFVLILGEEFARRAVAVDAVEAAGGEHVELGGDRGEIDAIRVGDRQQHGSPGSTERLAAD